LTLNPHEIVDKLATVDERALLDHLTRLQQLTADLKAAPRGSYLARQLVERVGRELDAARHVVRPYYRR
jgi:hypothetical protein